ncbi:RNA methyltransferase [Propionimicrobium sp. PCR01-08-3]|uniref:TrmH family RNA methyltransferase n=1 Tax=Propionimicrobium sp. PCR01-08-3 TaxID=3052086 RepID=UPI00255C3C7D|nr:RNA methyltransferase [Propionimicrobium sp. PCR01-08-3]WIY81506.1 RNA methyltransferase [Propionimicrobium sp. PCR01-08-3]
MTDINDGPHLLAPISKAELRAARRLHQRKGRLAAGEFLIEGAQAVREALLGPDEVRLLIVDDPDRHTDLLGYVDDVPVVGAGPDEIRQLADTVTSQGIFAIVRDVPVRLADIPWTARLVVICAQVRDPGNAGTVIRCADAFGADGVVLTKGSVERTNPKTVRASVGSIFHLPVISGLSIAEAVDWAHDQGMQVFAADAGGTALDELPDAKLARPTAWVMGNEAWGLPDDVIELVDEVVSIPMWGAAESLNLSTAAAVCLYASAVAQHHAIS